MCAPNRVELLAWGRVTARSEKIQYEKVGSAVDLDYLINRNWNFLRAKECQFHLAKSTRYAYAVREAEDHDNYKCLGFLWNEEHDDARDRCALDCL